MSVKITVAQALLGSTFRVGRAAIEYDSGAGHGAYAIKQVAVMFDKDGASLAISRHRGFNSKLTDPWPKWQAVRGSGVGPNGFFGIWLPHIDELWSVCRVVGLPKDDRWAEHREIGQTTPILMPLGITADTARYAKSLP